MPSERRSIAMGEEEAWSFVDAQRDMHVATINADGTPHLTTNWFAFRAQRQIAFNAYERSQKVVNLRRDPRVTLLFAAGEIYGELRGVSLKGRVRFLDDEAENLQVLRAIHARNEAFTEPRLTGDATPEIKSTKRICMAVDVDRIISWDHGKLAAAGKPTREGA